MKIYFKLTILLILIACGVSFLTDKKNYSNWVIKNDIKNKSEISWAKFEWTSDTLNGKYFEKTSMNIPCKIGYISNVFSFQFDLGANLSGVYENTFSSFYDLNETSKHKIKRLKCLLQFWNNNKYFDNIELNFGNYTATNKIGFVYKNYGEKYDDIKKTDTIHLGTIGSDLFKDKVLIIDYPNRQFAICDNIPNEYNNNLFDIELDDFGRVVLQMKIHNKNYKILFDNGSSIFPLITESKNISKFSILPDIDTITISSWGKNHDVTGKMINDTFELGGQKFCNVKVYANHSGLGIDKNTDGMAGNALFWDKIIIIDFKNKKFGVK